MKQLKMLNIKVALDDAFFSEMSTVGSESQVWKSIILVFLHLFYSIYFLSITFIISEITSKTLGYSLGGA